MCQLLADWAFARKCAAPGSELSRMVLNVSDGDDLFLLRQELSQGHRYFESSLQAAI